MSDISGARERLATYARWITDGGDNGYGEDFPARRVDLLAILATLDAVEAECRKWLGVMAVPPGQVAPDGPATEFMRDVVRAILAIITGEGEGRPQQDTTPDEFRDGFYLGRTLRELVQEQVGDMLSRIERLENAVRALGKQADTNANFATLTNETLHQHIADGTAHRPSPYIDRAKPPIAEDTP